MEKYDIDYVQVGRGRLGNLIAQHVLENGQIKRQNLANIQSSKNGGICYAQINPQTGLLDLSGSPISCVINRLVICISPGRSKLWQWQQLFVGMLKQVENNQLKINHLIFISSTRVYDGISRGMINVTTPAIARSERAKSLLKAESYIERLASCFHILRCSGLYGQEYQKYLDILSNTSNGHGLISEVTDQPRFGVNLEIVVQTVIKRLKQNKRNSSYTLLTDGFCYFKGDKSPIHDVEQLSLEYKLFLPGCIEIIESTDNKKPG